jgi:hypothetical protein
VAYIVTVPQSTRAPHQASDKRFYKRFNFQSVAMEEYEIRDVARRAETPDLRIEFELIKPPNYTQGVPASEPFSLNVIITNDALEPANYAVIEIYVDGRINVLSYPDLSITQNIFLAFNLQDEVTRHPITILRQNWGIPGKLPIFQARFNITNTSLMFKTPDYVPMTQQNYLLGFQIQSPRMPKKQAFTLLTVASDLVKLSEQYLSYDELVSSYHTILWDSRERTN